MLVTLQSKVIHIFILLQTAKDSITEELMGIDVLGI